MTRSSVEITRGNDRPANPKMAAMSSHARPSGLSPIGELSWGTHICAFYEAKQDALDMVTAYFKAGLESGEYCIWAISDQITEGDALAALRNSIPRFDMYLRSGSIEIVPGWDWYLKGSDFDLQRILDGWWDKLDRALANGYAGMRVCGNAFWFLTDRWSEFGDYEHELDRALTGRRMLVMCTYLLGTARATDILDAARAHQYTLTHRDGRWEFLSTQELAEARAELKRLNTALDVMLKSLPESHRLTTAERGVLPFIVRGKSAKEVARALGLSPRTVEFHRANILQKLQAKNVTELVFRALSE